MKFKCSACGKKFRAELNGNVIRQLPCCPGKLFKKCGAEVDENDEYVGRFKRAWRWLTAKKVKVLPAPEEPAQVYETFEEGHAGLRPDPEFYEDPTINLDPVKGVSGSEYPIGTPEMPVNNLADAGKIAERWGLKLKTPDFVTGVLGAYRHLHDLLDEPENMTEEEPPWLMEMSKWLTVNRFGGTPTATDGLPGCRLNYPDASPKWKGVKVRFPGMTEDAVVATDGTILRIRGLRFSPIEVEMKPAGLGAEPFDRVESGLTQPMIEVVRGMLANARALLNKSPKDAEFLIKTLTKRGYLIEHKTIRVSGPRQSGNTTAAVEIAKDLGPERCLFVTATEGLRCYAWKLGLDEKRVFSVHGIVHDRHRGLEYNHLIIDNASVIEPVSLQEIIRRVEPRLTHDSWIIMTG